MNKYQNKAPRHKQRGINCALQSAGFQPVFAPRGGELNPKRLKNIKPRVSKKYSRIKILFNILCQRIREKINKGIDNDILPLIIAPLIFISFAGLEWWSWYLEVSIPSPILLIIVVTVLGVLCYISELLDRRESVDKKESAGVTADHKHPELH